MRLRDLFWAGVIVVTASRLLGLRTQVRWVPQSLVSTESNMQHENDFSDVDLPITLSLIVELRGEMGNQLSVLVGARITQCLLERELPGVKVQLIGQHQNNKYRWNKGRDDLVRCFPNISSLVFSGGIWDTDPDTSNFVRRQVEQERWLGKEHGAFLSDISSRKQVAFLKELLLQQKRNHTADHDSFSHREFDEKRTKTSGDGTSVDYIVRRRSYSLPYLTAKAMVTFKALNDPEVYHDLRSWLSWNETACCRLKPRANETVYHFRNFLTELGDETAWRKGFVELSPQRTAEHLFHNVTLSKNLSGYNASSGSDVVIVSRYTENLHEYTNALHQAGISARIQRGQTGVEDFCFLMAAQRELVGSVRSTFTRWAAILGNATSNNLFSVSRENGANFSSGIVRYMDGRTFRFDTYHQPEVYSLDVKQGREGAKRLLNMQLLHHR